MRKKETSNHCSKEAEGKDEGLQLEESDPICVSAATPTKHTAVDEDAPAEGGEGSGEDELDLRSEVEDLPEEESLSKQGEPEASPLADGEVSDSESDDELDRLLLLAQAERQAALEALTCQEQVKQQMDEELARKQEQLMEEKRRAEVAERRRQATSRKLAEIGRMRGEAESLRRYTERVSLETETRRARLGDMAQQAAIAPHQPLERTEDLECEAEARRLAEEQLDEKLRLQLAEADLLALQREEQLQVELLERERAAELAAIAAAEAKKRAAEDARRATQADRERRLEESTRQLLAEVELKYQAHIDAMKDAKKAAEWTRRREDFRLFTRRLIRTSLDGVDKGGTVMFWFGGKALRLAGTLLGGLCSLLGGTAKVSLDISGEILYAFGDYVEAKVHERQLALAAPPARLLLRAPPAPLALCAAPPTTTTSPSILAASTTVGTRDGGAAGITARIGDWLGSVLPGGRKRGRTTDDDTRTPDGKRARTAAHTSHVRALPAPRDAAVCRAGKRTRDCAELDANFAATSRTDCHTPAHHPLTAMPSSEQQQEQEQQEHRPVRAPKSRPGTNVSDIRSSNVTTEPNTTFSASGSSSIGGTFTFAAATHPQKRSRKR